MKNEWIDLSPVELERTYVFDSGFTQSIKNVRRIKVSLSNHHYLETVDGEKWIIPPKWIGIKLKVDSWTF